MKAHPTPAIILPFKQALKSLSSDMVIFIFYFSIVNGWSHLTEEEMHLNYKDWLLLRASV